ncbi:MAG: riboflavin synthase [Candidatus Thermochlorobacter aerophilum]|jgi:riboflavin synthase|uniref:Riboflavin synthase n=1 Tax=Candidatus Thermochlorobacter aerophilus TaxID=1868324 RepID=A0A395M385_9BACT|nr:MAG: riboflavin synthase [Candidatus Thermochlorobacter aerophilum]
MFTGIIKDVGTVKNVARRGNGLRLTIEFQSEQFDDLSVDESISLSGACQTVVAVHGKTFEVDTVEETLKKTTLGSWRVGTKVNLERAVRASDRMGGHYVQGHVDCVGEITEFRQLSASWLCKIRFDEQFEPYIVPVGSIAVDGISLTVADLQRNVFTVAIIPYTYEHTTLKERSVGDKVNLEFDILGKYVAKQVQAFMQGGRFSAPLTEARLKELGY